MSTDNQAARARIFAKLKTVLKDGPPATERQTYVAQRLKAPPVHPKPARIQVSRDGLRALFKSHLEGQSATVVEVPSSADVPSAVAQYLRSNNLPQRIRFGSDAALAALPWNREPALTRDAGPAAATDETGVSHAAAAVAETGTLALFSGADNPVTLNYVPETHVIVVHERDLVGGYEEVWPKVRAKYGVGQMPRTVNLISGPSRTGDIGGKLVMGAHGPRRMCVILVRG